MPRSRNLEEREMGPVTVQKDVVIRTICGLSGLKVKEYEKGCMKNEVSLVTHIVVRCERNEHRSAERPTEKANTIFSFRKLARPKQTQYIGINKPSILQNRV